MWHVREWRKVRGFKRANSFAAMIGRSPQALSAIENGHAAPSLQTLHKIVQVLGITLDELASVPSLNLSEQEVKDIENYESIMRSWSVIAEQYPGRLPQLLSAAERLTGRSRKQ